MGVIIRTSSPSVRATINPLSKAKRLPLFSQLQRVYPKYGIDYSGGGVTDADFGNILGGKVKLNIDMYATTGGREGFGNTCALRISHTLNKSSHKIPKISGETSSSKDRDWHIFRVLILVNHLKNNYSNNPKVYIEESGSSIDQSKFLGKKGIIIFIIDIWDDAGGHATLWDGSKRLGGNYNSSFYFSNAKKVMLWVAD